MDPVHEEQHGRYTIKVYQDDQAESPRTYYDEHGRMICFHRRYDLGDKHTESHELHAQDFRTWIEKESARGNIVALPLYLMDHGGITMDTVDFTACDPQGWDWGLVGYIYSTKDMIRAEYGCKRVTKKVRERVKLLLESEVRTYNNYLTGNVYGYVIEDQDGNEVDAVWGYYGDYQTDLLVDARQRVNEFAEYDRCKK